MPGDYHRRNESFNWTMQQLSGRSTSNSMRAYKKPALLVVKEDGKGRRRGVWGLFGAAECGLGAGAGAGAGRRVVKKRRGEAQFPFRTPDDRFLH